MTDLLTPGDDFAAIADDDAFLSALATEAGVDGLDPTKSLLLQWRDELSAAVPAAAVPLPTVAADAIVDDRPAPRQWYRSRGAAGATALFVVLAASTGVAAAMPGNRVHQALFGASTTSEDLYGARVTALLGEVATGIEAANTAGGITDSDRAALGDKLAAAAALLGKERAPDPALGAQLSSLHDALAALPSLPSVVPDADDPADGATSDRHPSGGTTGEDADDGQDTDERTGSANTDDGDDDADGENSGDDDGTSDGSDDRGSDDRGSDDGGSDDGGSDDGVPVIDDADDLGSGSGPDGSPDEADSADTGSASDDGGTESPAED